MISPQLSKKFWKNKLTSSPARIISLSFAAVILFGTFLLMLPFSSREGVITPFLDCLFTATSATCVTGLVVHDTYHYWTPFGQFVIIGLIQIGGLGLVTFTSFFNLMIGKKLGLRGIHLAQESTNSLGEDVGKLLKLVVGTSLVVEGTGALLLSTQLVPQYGWKGLPMSIFTSISAFCNAGFDLFGQQGEYSSLTNYNNNPVILFTIGFLIIIGGIGFIVISDLMQYRRTKKLTLHTRVVLLTTLILIFLGMFITALLEWNNPATLDSLPNLWQKLQASWFHSVSCRTAGFNSISMSELTNPTKIWSSLLMFCGAAPGSTGGGIKCTTVAVIMMTVFSVVRGGEDTVIFHRRVDKSAVYKSLAVMVLGAILVAVTSGAIVATMYETHQVSAVDAFFESVSAFATVGLSAGISENANLLCKCLLIFSMYLGRLGPVSFFLSLAMRSSVRRKEIVPEGKIQIG